ncbi:hypothetical protein [Streptomyces sp. NPDC056723]|uniref:hypothetical protein n=1 Tax=Streptomyces sp. NPDC056723 TaxID=3345925 RepID=UPI00367D4F4C
MTEADEAAQAGDAERYGQLVHEFHELIITGAGNGKLGAHYRTLMDEVEDLVVFVVRLSDAARLSECGADQAGVGELVLHQPVGCIGSRGQVQGLPQPDRILHRPVRDGAAARLLPGRTQRPAPDRRTLRPLQNPRLGVRRLGGGVAASVPFWQSTLYTGPFSVAFPGAGDLSMFVAAAAGAVLYLLTYRLKPLRQRTTGNPGQAPAQRPDRTTDLAEHT